MLLALLAGCGLGLDLLVRDTGTPFVPEEEAPQVTWSVEPAVLTLGETYPGVAAAGQLTLKNTGRENLLVLDLGASIEDHIEVSLAGAPILAPGESTLLYVEWTPTEPGVLSSALAISVGVSDEEPQAVAVPVAGTSLGPVVTISTTTWDFGEIGIGCDEEFTVTLTNTGNLAMEVQAVSMHGEEGFSTDPPEDLPWVLAPYQSHAQTVYFSPSILGQMNGQLTFETDVGEFAAALQGTGVVDEERTLSYDVGEQGRSTFIVNVNLTAIPNSSEDQYSTFFVAALPTFFQTLLDNHVHYRAGFVWNVNGSVDGEYDYIDETFTASEATDAALLMIAPGAHGGDNDANFRTIQNAIVANQDWLSEDSGWAESRLCLFTIQRDTEASGGSWSNWVSQAQAYKDDPADIVYHAIAGPVPGGCGSAEAFRDYDQAVTATGGLFLSVCASDWTDHMAQVATACTEGATGIFPIEGTPMVESIVVTTDGMRQDEGWYYDSSLNAVVFEENAYPEFESTVEIYYWMGGVCG
ncbi:MAG: choice-of-anchor D domain-containing protein [Pseudomonadota bacterium]